MPSQLASLLTWGFILWLFRRDIRQKPNVTGALWLPLIWLFILCSRAISEWLALFGINVGGVSVEEGSPVDACFYFALILAGICVLARRGVSLSEIVRNNRWLMVFFIYCFLAVFWSDFMLVSFKRWIKVFGHPIMVLIILTEPDPKEAFKTLMKRCAYLLLPLSILFIKYYPQWGRTFSEWTGEAQQAGVAHDKNSLGGICMIFGFFFLWHLVNVWKTDKGKARRDELLLCGGFLWMIGWLFWGLNCGTAVVSLMVGVLVMLLVGLPRLNHRSVGLYLLGAVALLLLAEWAFGLSDVVLGLLGKDPTLTGRTKVWHELFQFNINPVIGTGFESFWLGDRLQTMAEWRWWKPNEAHNGYIETYLNMGLAGLFVLICVLIATYHKACRELLRNLEWGQYRLGFLVAILLYNWTEAGFRGLSTVYFMFYLIAMDYPNPQAAPAAQVIETDGVEMEPELAGARE